MDKECRVEKLEDVANLINKLSEEEPEEELFLTINFGQEVKNSNEAL